MLAWLVEIIKRKKYKLKRDKGLVLNLNKFQNVIVEKEDGLAKDSKKEWPERTFKMVRKLKNTARRNKGLTMLNATERFCKRKIDKCQLNSTRSLVTIARAITVDNRIEPR